MRKTTEADIDRDHEIDGYQGFILRREGGRLARLASLVPAGECIVEIGSFKGKSACYLARGSKRGAAVKVHCVDLWDLGGQVEYQLDDLDRIDRSRRNVPRGSDDPDTYGMFHRQIAQARVKSMIVEHKAASLDAAAAWAGPPIGLLFIDGDHTYDGALADVTAWTPHLAPGAWVCWHDYRRPNRFPDVQRAVDAWLAETSTVEVTRTANLLAAQLP